MEAIAPAPGEMLMIQHARKNADHNCHDIVKVLQEEKGNGIAATWRTTTDQSGDRFLYEITVRDH
ncbi:MAG: hypothetical protein ACTH1W_10550 [Advenella sp.]